MERTSLSAPGEFRWPYPGNSAVRPWGVLLAAYGDFDVAADSADLRLVRGHDVMARSGGVIVCVRGRHPRVVPVRAELAERALRAARWAGPGFIVGGAEPNRRNVTSPLIASLAGGRDLPRLSLARLRSTWVARCAGDIGLATFMAAAGIACSQRLGDVVARLDPGDEARAVALLGGRRT